jgi:hypothetical protein
VGLIVFMLAAAGCVFAAFLIVQMAGRTSGSSSRWTVWTR